MTDRTGTSFEAARFQYEGRELHFYPPAGDDHIIQLMRRHRTFYEIDVLERIRGLVRMRGDPGLALDVGAFVGTHTVYFASFCGCNVRCYEPNPQVFPTLLANLAANGVDARVVAVNAALGAVAGRASLVAGPANNLGNTRLGEAGGASTAVRVATLDEELQAEPQRVVILKIDVEGAELKVLAGASETIRRYRPILCVEAHTFGNLFRMLARLRKDHYCAVDCLGYSPTYVFISSRMSLGRRLLLDALWLARALAPASQKWRLSKLARRVPLSATA